MRAIALSLFALTTLAACQSNQAVPMAPNVAPALVQAASADLNASYSFRKPTAYLKVDLYVTDDKATAQAHIKEFFAKYVDKNDIFNYQTVQDDTKSDLFTINIYGGNQEFVMQKLLPDLRFYLNQRMRFDNLNIYKGY